MARVWLFVSLISVVGCGRGGREDSPPPATARGDVAGPAKDVPPASSRPATARDDVHRVKDYRVKVARYVGAARAAAKLLESRPPVPEVEVRAKEKEVLALFDQVADVPPEVDTTGKVLGRLNNVKSCTLVAVGFHAQAAHNPAQAGEIHNLILPGTIADIRRFADEVETRVGR